MKHPLLSILTLSAFALTAKAETVLLFEDFNDDYSKSFPYMYDADRQTINPAIASIFYSSIVGDHMPWWIVKDYDGATDKFIASHSYYTTPGKSNDWLISVPLEISTDGFILGFDAQSVPIRGLDYLSDLSIIITEELLDPMNIPQEPTYTWTQIPCGDDVNNCEGDWTHFSFPLDEYAGKTIYVNFVNKSEDKDIVSIDNVKVSRFDAADLKLAPYEQFTTLSSLPVQLTIKGDLEEGATNWSVDLTNNGNIVQHWDGETLALNEEIVLSADLDLILADPTQFAFTFSCDQAQPLTIKGKSTRLLFKPTHRVFYEETTSLHCGNCPMGIFVGEMIEKDENLAPFVIPVNVHIMNLGYDPMALEDYYQWFPNSDAAPLVYVDRNSAYDGFNPLHDSEYDPSNEFSFAYRISQKGAQLAPLDVNVAADWVISGSDTTAIKCKATVVPAYNISDLNCRVAFILTENNVGLDGNIYWRQENYLSGKDYASRFGGWCDLPAQVKNARYHDVARAISRFNGHPESLPEYLEVGEEYEFEYELPIPDTYAVNDKNGYPMSDAIRTDFCEITAIVIDYETGLVINAARVPMSEIANDRFDTHDLYMAGIESIAAESDAPDAYFDLQGRPISNPRGICIEVKAGKARVVVK